MGGREVQSLKAEARLINRRLGILVVVALPLTGCMTAQERMEAQARQDDAQCSYAPKGSQNYNDCRKALVTVRQMNAQEAAGYNAGAAMQNAGAWLQARDAGLPNVAPAP